MWPENFVEPADETEIEGRQKRSNLETGDDNDDDDNADIRDVNNEGSLSVVRSKLIIFALPLTLILVINLVLIVMMLVSSILIFKAF